MDDPALHEFSAQIRPPPVAGVLERPFAQAVLAAWVLLVGSLGFVAWTELLRAAWYPAIGRMPPHDYGLSGPLRLVSPCRHGLWSPADRARAGGGCLRFVQQPPQAVGGAVRCVPAELSDVSGSVGLGPQSASLRPLTVGLRLGDADHSVGVSPPSILVALGLANVAGPCRRRSAAGVRRACLAKGCGAAGRLLRCRPRLDRRPTCC